MLTHRAYPPARATLVTVEDHWPQGGLADAVLEAFGTDHPMPRLTRLAPHSMPASATPEEQLYAAGIDASAVEAAARALLNRTRTAEPDLEARR